MLVCFWLFDAVTSDGGFGFGLGWVDEDRPITKSASYQEVKWFLSSNEKRPKKIVGKEEKTEKTEKTTGRAE